MLERLLSVIGREEFAPPRFSDVYDFQTYKLDVGSLIADSILSFLRYLILNGDGVQE